MSEIDFDKDDGEKKKITQELSLKISEKMGENQTAQLLALSENLLKNKQDKTKILFIALIVMTGLFLMTFIAWLSYPKNRFVAMTNASEICEVTPENNPNLNDKTIALFAQEAVIHTNSFSFADYEQKIEWVMSNYYNDEGRKQAVAGIKSFGLLDTVKDNLFTVKATVNGVPSIADIDKKKNVWRVYVPILLEVYGATNSPREVQHLLATVDVSAQNASSVNSTGLGVSRVTYERVK